MVSPFLRAKETTTGVLSSRCALCSRVVAHSSKLDYLAVAEAAHNCRNGHKKESEEKRDPKLPSTYRL